MALDMASEAFELVQIRAVKIIICQCGDFHFISFQHWLKTSRYRYIRVLLPVC